MGIVFIMLKKVKIPRSMKWKELDTLLGRTKENNKSLMLSKF